jgi:hypothetical protein
MPQLFLVENINPPENKRERSVLVSRYAVIADTSDNAIITAIRHSIAHILDMRLEEVEHYQIDSWRLRGTWSARPEGAFMQLPHKTAKVKP